MKADLRAHRASVQAALALNDDLAHLFARVGTAQHPRGQVVTAYRNARRALRDVFQRSGTRLGAEAAEVLRGLRANIGLTAGQLLTDAAQTGAQSGRRQAEIRAVVVGERPPVVLAPLATAWTAGVDAQIAAAAAALQAGLDYEALILGAEEAGRLGILNPAPVARDGSKWLAAAALLGWLAELGGERLYEAGWNKQAASAIDERTTECCLRINGAIVPWHEPWHTTGRPAWAEYQRWMPFHWW